MSDMTGLVAYTAHLQAPTQGKHIPISIETVVANEQHQAHAHTHSEYDDTHYNVGQTLHLHL